MAENKNVTRITAKDDAPKKAKAPAGAKTKAVKATKVTKTETTETTEKKNIFARIGGYFKGAWQEQNEGTTLQIRNSGDDRNNPADMDVFDSAFAPGVSASNACGLHPYQVKKILRRIMKSNKVRLMDVVETNPDFDQDNRTTRLAAHMISEMVHGL